ncbi:Golgi transport complex subunit 3 [Polyrhizophydium stewartii]|uniref:Conserved oligomeric Golgi complex subunit 3 n=1 Tax=Polyrhizophydium stewartii TaxID=2732419 RepID=A0ABR4NFA2_9FUNG
MSASALAPLRSFEEWEARGVLSSRQLESIALLQAAAAELPVPEELATEAPAGDAVSEDGRGAAASAADGATGVHGVSPRSAAAAPAAATHPLAVESTIESTQQFLAWFAKVEEDMERGQEDIYRTCLATVRGYRDSADEILAKANEADALLDELERNYNFVEDKTKGLQIACETLLDEQTHLITVAEELASKLAYFNELEPITKLLSAPGEAIVLDDRFGPMLQKLDQCLAFVYKHPHYKDAELYRMRYRQCMTRSMTLIKMHFVDSIRALHGDIREKLAGRQTHEPLPTNMQLTLFYVKFRTLASRVKHLVSEIEERCNTHPEYLALLRDCFAAFFVVRRTLLGPFIADHIKTINSATTSLLEFTAKGCAYMIRLCADEYQLFRQFFDLGEDEALVFLESLATNLYDQLRPLIIRENKLDTLSDLCQSLISYLKTLEPAPGEEREDPEILSTNAAPVKFIVQKILEDSQQRLAFRAEAFVRQELQNFRPREEELLVLARGRGLPQPAAINFSVGVAPVLSDSLESVSGPHKGGDSVVPSPLTTTLSANLEAALDENASELQGAFVIGKLAYGGGEWYPTLQRALYVLGRLYGSVPEPVFEDLAQEVVDSCRQSLVAASEVLSAKQTKLDGQLFLIKNLLMLREQTSTFDARFVRVEGTVSFMEMMEALRSVIQNSWRAGAISAIGGAIMAARATTVVQSYADAKELLDRELKRVCEDLILETGKAATDPISAFMLKVSAFRLRNEARPFGSRDMLKNQSFAQPNQIGVVFEALKESVQQRLALTVARMADYLGDKKTQSVLIRIMRSNILETYQVFADIVAAEYDTATRARIATPAEMASLVDSALSAQSALFAEMDVVREWSARSDADLAAALATSPDGAAASTLLRMVRAQRTAALAHQRARVDAELSLKTALLGVPDRFDAWTVLSLLRRACVVASGAQNGHLLQAVWDCLVRVRSLDSLALADQILKTLRHHPERSFAAQQAQTLMSRSHQLLSWAIPGDLDPPAARLRYQSLQLLGSSSLLSADRQSCRKAAKLLLLATEHMPFKARTRESVVASVDAFIRRVYDANEFSVWWKSLSHPGFTEFCAQPGTKMDRQTLKLCVLLLVSELSRTPSAPSVLDRWICRVYGDDETAARRSAQDLIALFADHDDDLCHILLALIRADAALRRQTGPSLDKTGSNPMLDRVCAACNPCRVFVLLMEQWDFDHMCMLDLIIQEDALFARCLEELLGIFVRDPSALPYACESLSGLDARSHPSETDSDSESQERGSADLSDADSTDYFASVVSTLSELNHALSRAHSRKLISKDVSSLLSNLHTFIQMTDESSAEI